MPFDFDEFGFDFPSSSFEHQDLAVDRNVDRTGHGFGGVDVDQPGKLLEGFSPLSPQATCIASRRSTTFDGDDLQIELANLFGERVDFRCDPLHAGAQVGMQVVRRCGRAS